MKKNNEYTQLKILMNQNPNWNLDPELSLIDHLLSNNYHLTEIVKNDYSKINQSARRGRKDSPDAEQVIRGIIYMKLKGLTYRQLDYQQYDSRIAGYFLKLPLKSSGFSSSTWQKYISAIQPETVKKLFIEITKIAIQEGFDSPNTIRIDSTAIESNVHYPTNNSLLWDCFKEHHRLTNKVPKIIRKALKIELENNLKQAKSHNFKLNNIKKNNIKYKIIFQNQIDLFSASFSQFGQNYRKLNEYFSLIDKDSPNYVKIGKLLIKMDLYTSNATKILNCCIKREINEEALQNSEKLFSIYETHTNIIVKGSRENTFGHKVNLSSGKNSIIFSCDILEGNPCDTKLYEKPIDSILDNYREAIETVATDGGYFSSSNRDFAILKGVKEVVFNKVVGKIKNIVGSEEREKALKKWRSGIEANISNLKRGFHIRRVNWKSFSGFRSEVLWSVIAYNIRRMAYLLLL